MWVQRKIPLAYLLLALPLTTVLCFATAPFFTPDEPNHAAHAIALGHGEWLAHLGPNGSGGEEAGAEIDENVLRVLEGSNAIRVAWERHAGDFHNRSYGPVQDAQQLALAPIRWSHSTVFVPFPNTVVYPPVLYLPAIVGWRLGETFDLTILNGLRLARLLCAWTGVALGWLALRLCAGSLWLLLPFLLLPSTLFLNASCSQDALLLPVAALAVALLAGALRQSREFTTTELLATTGLLALCATARPPYAAMAPLLFLPSMERAGGDWLRWLKPLVGLVGVWAACALWRHMVAPLGLDWSDQADPDLQAGFLRTHPFRAAAALLHGTWDAVIDFLRRGVYVVGWNDLLPHHFVAPIVVVALAAMVFAMPRLPIRSWRGRGLLASAIAGSLLGIALAEYIIWTPPGFHTVYGEQPRYWLPVMPLALLLAAGILPNLPRWRNRLLLGAAALLAMIGCTLPWMVAHAFYREGLMHVLSLNLR